MKRTCIFFLIGIFPFLNVIGVNVYRYNPSNQSVTITQGNSITFSIGADDPYGLDFSEWYVGSAYQTTHELQGYYDEDTWSKTFSTVGTFYIYCYVYNINGANSYTWWAITVQEPPIGSVQITSPNGGENWISGSTHAITWSINGNISTIDIQYTVNNGNNWIYIASPSPNSGSYSWVLPANINSSQCKVKIIGYYLSQSTLDLSNSTFTISSNITVTSPNGGESWMIGSSHPITWTSSGISGNVKIEINGNYPSGTWETLFANTANDGSENWTVSGTAGTAKRVQITSLNNTNVSDISNSNFTIVGPTATITSPNGGESYTSGTTHAITWSITGNLASIDLQYTVDNGNNWIYIASPTPSSLTYSWAIPSNINSALCKVKILGYYNSQLVTSDESNSTFTISSNITVTSPNGGESWMIGSSYPITWTSSGISGNVKIEINGNYPSGTWETLFASTANDGSENWTVSGMAGTAKRIQITSNNNTNISDISNNNFTIVGPTATITSPNGGESYTSGTTHAITWSITGNLASIDLQYTVDNGNTWTYIASPTPSSLNYSWSIPSNINSTLCKVKILGYYNSQLVTSDESNSTFTISSNITITSPNGGESWTLGSSHPITWTSSGITGNVKIEINGNYPSGDWETLFASTSNDGTENWTVSGMAGNQKRIKITSTNNSSIADISNNNFSIINSTPTAIVSPNGGEKIGAGTTTNIAWTVNPNIYSIDLQYTTDEGKTWNYIASPAPSSSPYSWSVPQGINSCTCKIKILGYPGPGIPYSDIDYSDNDFSIILTPSNFLTLIWPNGGEVWQKNDAQDITWCSSNNINNVKIELFKNGNLYSIITNSTPNNGVFPYTVTNVIDGTDYKIKISDVNNSSCNDISKKNFIINTGNKTLDFSGILWNISNGYGTPGPDYNYFYNGNELIFKDEIGRLHVKMKNINGSWYCPEIQSQAAFGYGEYIMYIETNPNNIDPRPVFGFFPYKDDNHEIDIELTKWNNEMGTNNCGWYTIQPGTESSKNNFNIDIIGANTSSTHKFNWTSQIVEFQSYAGQSPTINNNLWNYSWSYNGSSSPIPNPDNMKLMINFWLYHGYTPLNNQPNNEIEYIITSVKVPGILSFNQPLKDVAVQNSQSKCFCAENMVLVAGNNSTFFIQNGSSCTIIAGQSIKFLPGTIVQPGGNLHGYIAPNGPWCESENSFMDAENKNEKSQQWNGTTNKNHFINEEPVIFYPNPTKGKVFFDFSSKSPNPSLYLEIVTTFGSRVFSKTITTNTTNSISLDYLANGMYIIKCILDGKVYEYKIVKY